MGIVLIKKKERKKVVLLRFEFFNLVIEVLKVGCMKRMFVFFLFDEFRGFSVFFLF